MKTVLLTTIMLLLVSGAVTAQDYSGEWAVSPCVEYTCGVLGVPVIDISVCSAGVLDQRPQIYVTPDSGEYGVMTGTFSSATQFSVSYVFVGDCSVTYKLDGEFTSDTTLVGTFTIVFTGSACSFSNCTNQTFPITGSRPKPSCCVGNVGNVDCSAGDGVDIGDLTALVDNLFISFTPLCCDAEANCDGSAGNGVDIGDLTALIDNLFISFTPLPACQ